MRGSPRGLQPTAYKMGTVDGMVDASRPSAARKFSSQLLPVQLSDSYDPSITLCLSRI